MTGTVFDVNNSPLPNLTIELHSGVGDYQTVTDAGGNFTFAQVLPGTATLEAYDSVSQSGAGAQLQVVPNQTTNQNLNLVQGTGSVTGTVTEFGFPIAGVHVVVVAANGRLETTTAADGTYSASPVSIGPVDVQASLNNLGGDTKGFLALPGTVVTIDVPIQSVGSWNLLPTCPSKDDRQECEAVLDFGLPIKTAHSVNTFNLSTERSAF